MLLLLRWPLYPQPPFGGPPLFPMISVWEDCEGRSSTLWQGLSDPFMMYCRGGFLVTGSLLLYSGTMWLRPQLPSSPLSQARLVAWSHSDGLYFSPWITECFSLDHGSCLPIWAVKFAFSWCWGPVPTLPWSSGKPMLCVWFSSSFAFTHCIMVYISCIWAVKFSERSIESCVKLNKHKSRVYRFHELIVIMNTFYKSNDVVDLQFLLFILYQFICKFCDCLKRFLFISILFR